MMNSMQTKTSTRTFGGLPVLGGFPHLCRSISLAAGAGLLLAGCSKEQMAESGNRVEIIPHAGLPASVEASEVTSRAVADPAQQMDFWFVRSDERSAGVWGDYGTAPLKATRKGGSGEQPLTFDLTQYYLTDGLKTRMTGWYPGGETEAGSPEGYYAAAVGTVSWTIDGRQDILLAAPRQGSKTSAMPVFEFRHALAQLQFRFYAESEIAFEQWGKILGVAVCGQRTAATFTPADAPADDLKVTFTGDASAKFAAANFATLTAPVGTKDDGAAGGDPVMIEPQENPSRLRIEVMTEKQGVQTVMVSARAYLQGQAVKICIRLAEHSVTIDPEGCEIVPWDNVTQTEDNEVGLGNERVYPYILNGNTIVFKDIFGEADPTEYPTHGPWTVTPAHSESAWIDNASGFNTYGEKFKVASQDAKGKDGSSETMTWYEAAGVTESSYNPDGYSACGEYYEETDRSDKGLWRLPTVAELKQILSRINDLTAVNEPSLGYHYWSATESSKNSINAWNVYHNNSITFTYTKTKDEDCVRCVRDLSGLEDTVSAASNDTSKE